jgi:hypothetical protein
VIWVAEVMEVAVAEVVTVTVMGWKVQGISKHLLVLQIPTPKAPQ